MDSNISLSKKHLGKIVYIELLDHAIAESPIKCKVVGFLDSFNKKKITVAYWDLIGEDDETRNYNKECICILRSAITNLKII